MLSSTAFWILYNFCANEVFDKCELLSVSASYSSMLLSSTSSVSSGSIVSVWFESVLVISDISGRVDSSEFVISFSSILFSNSSSNSSFSESLKSISFSMSLSISIL